MANHKSALKRIRQTETATARRRDRLSRMKTMIKKFITVNDKVIGESCTAQEKEMAFRNVQSEIASGVTHGILHKNTAARKISKLSKALKASC